MVVWWVNCVMVGHTDKIKHSQSEPDQDLQLKMSC